MYGYPEQFIPEPELVAYGARLPADGTAAAPRPASVTAMSAGTVEVTS